jgi:hypothetical protein
MEVRVEALADQRLYTEVGLVPVTCAACGGEVGVKKNSQQHTSIQWTAAATRMCHEFARGVGESCGALPLGCDRLRESIDAAIADGSLVVPDA